MDFWQTVVVLVRRWYVAVPTFLGSLALAGFAYAYVPTQYESGTVLALTTPLAGSTQSSSTRGASSLTNPLMNFDGSLSLTGSLLIQQLNTAATASDLGVTPGGPLEYQVTNGSTNPELLETGPFLFIHGTGPTPDAAEGLTERVARKAIEVLATRQQEVKAPDATHIGMQRVVPVTAGQPLKGSAERAAAAVLALALLASLFAVYGFESYMTSTRRRRAAARSPQPGRQVGREVPTGAVVREQAGSR